MERISHIFAPKNNNCAHNGQMTAFYIIAVLFCTGAFSAINCENAPKLCTMRSELSLGYPAIQSLLFIWRYLELHFIAFFLGSSFLGCFLLPLLSGVFGFFFYCEAEGLMTGGKIADSAVSFAALLLLASCFFVVAVDAFCASSQLREMLACCSLHKNRNRLFYLMICCVIAVIAAYALVFY